VFITFLKHTSAISARTSNLRYTVRRKLFQFRQSINTATLTAQRFVTYKFE